VRIKVKLRIKKNKMKVIGFIHLHKAASTEIIAVVATTKAVCPRFE
jgi:hypothetical protein